MGIEKTQVTLGDFMVVEVCALIGDTFVVYFPFFEKESGDSNIKGSIILKCQVDF